MKRNGYIALTAAVAAGIAVVLLATGAFSDGHDAPGASGQALACLPGGGEYSAALAGTSVDVSPQPSSDTAAPDTQISFLGVPADEIRDVSVEGSSSGRHDGRLRAYSQGDGASFLPEKPFQPGERVRVHAAIGARAKTVSFGFRVDAPFSTATVPEFPNPAAAPTDYQAFETLPGVQAPVLSVTVPDRDPAAGDILTTNGPGPGQYGPLIYTPQGRLVWFHRLPRGVSAEDLNVQSYAGQRDLTFWQGRVLSLGFGQGEDLVLNSSYQTVARVGGGNGLHADLHDFQIAPHGIAYITAFNPIRCDLSSAGGERDGAILDTAIQEIDMRTGLVRWEWHSLDHVKAAESETSPPKGTPWDWFHINSIDLQGDGDIFISARSTWAGYEIERATGKILWRLGGTNSSFKMGPGTKTAWQHDGRILANGEITLFDDGSNPPVHPESRAVRIVLDFKKHEAHLGSSYTHPSPLLAASQGNMQTLADGNTLVDYGGVPQISEYAADGALLFDAALPYDMSTYRAFRFPWRGHPFSPPALLASLNNTGEETIVHMSWNGATEVASWRVLAGPSGKSLKTRASAPASSFESSTILPQKYAYVAVQALGPDGRLLASSKPARVGPYSASLGQGAGDGH